MSWHVLFLCMSILTALEACLETRGDRFWIEVRQLAL